jgi:hypothetical protein
MSAMKEVALQPVEPQTIGGTATNKLLINAIDQRRLQKYENSQN